jgi:hypothetical protein
LTDSVEREARNESIFRDANEKLRKGRDTLAAAGERTPFLCECEDQTCTKLMLLTVAEYERARSLGDCFLVVPEHEPRTSGQVLARGDGHILVQKSGRTGELARELDPRAEKRATVDEPSRGSTSSSETA